MVFEPGRSQPTGLIPGNVNLDARTADDCLSEVRAVKLPESDEFASVHDKELEQAYLQMANDAEHEREAQEWCEALISDGIE